MSSFILAAIGKVLSFWPSAARSVNKYPNKGRDTSPSNEKMGVFRGYNLGENAAHYKDNHGGETPCTLGVCLHSDLMR